MKYCSKCGKEFPEDAKFCPYCGDIVKNKKENTSNEDIPAEKDKRKKRIIAVIVAAVLVISGVILYVNVMRVNTYNNFANLYNTMSEGVVKAEKADMLLIDVWRNSIWKTSNKKTDKFTKTNGGNGYFYSDFNDALDKLYDSKKFTKEILEICKFQEDAKELMRKLSKHSNSFNDEYSDFKKCYKLFMKFTDMPINCNGSLNSFTEKQNKLDEKLVDSLKELDLYFE